MGPDPAVAAVRRAVRRALSGLDPGDTVLVACSGGADSLALLAASVFEARSGGWRVIGVTVDHGLQAGSAERAHQVVDQMSAIGAAETMVATVKVDAPGMGPEAAAREARYAVLEEMAQRAGAAAVLLGHTRDDQAETVLLGLTRGSGGRALAGMRRSFDVFLRPLLDVSRADTEQACAAQGLSPWQDPHNADPAYTRSRLRHHVMPVLESELGPGVAVALARTADLLRADVEYLDTVARETHERLATSAGLAVEELAALHPAIRGRVLRLAALRAGAVDAELFHQHVAAVDALVTDYRGQRWIELPGHLRAYREGGFVAFRRAPL